MPEWLRELQTQHLTAEDLSSVASKVAVAGEAHIRQTARIKPTEIDRQRRFSM
jgi:hypothetical protein